MKALNKESILDCDELETQLHDAEIKQLDEQIFLMLNYPCEFEVTFLDDYHKKPPILRILPSKRYGIP
ncbi:Uncharacterised protein [Streptococcus pneumoniae]|uniref:Uncharacterized protein n=1 Tax=Streptococcus pneumoniae TaxID=1313 RepID=A0A4J2C3D8_STREE|nr:Uncharacterised protein [Streptococcus pneumoniae]CZC66118.1 Uncharacterised protein [Streptococcus pneumoniae]CZC67529.1 Uncharacterised protein [Streptococcus pneumoniae]CZC82831.1 Uncharacterised protein [Streptococcus pneumoniae]CZC85281.1 Uncharacterised protein [Streptococcus pneumoniae]